MGTYQLKNRVQLIGNVGNTPEISKAENGKQFARFSIATNEIYRNVRGEKVKETQWHSVVGFGKVAEVVMKYVNKGSEVAIEGKLINTNYTDSQNCKRYRTEIQINEILLLGTGSKSY